MERHTTEKESTSLPVQEYSRKKDFGRPAAGHYVKLSQVEVQKAKGETPAFDASTKQETAQKAEDSTWQDVQTKSIAELVQTAKTEWIHFGFIQAQAKSKTRWQTYGFVLTVFFVGILLVDIWLYMDRAMYAKELQQVRQEFGAAKMELALASAAADKTNQLQSENKQLAIENSVLKAQNGLFFSKAESFNESAQHNISDSILTAKAPQPGLAGQQKKDFFDIQQVSRSVTSEAQKNQPLGKNLTESAKSPVETLGQKAEPETVKNQSGKLQEKENEKQKQEREKRIRAIQKGLFPKDMTKAELIASLGRPDRIYKGPVYEQLVYFDHSPRRFWFKNGPFFEGAE